MEKAGSTDSFGRLMRSGSLSLSRAEQEGHYARPYAKASSQLKDIVETGRLRSQNQRGSTTADGTSHSAPSRAVLRETSVPILNICSEHKMNMMEMCFA